jgi:hypothetical protein
LTVRLVQFMVARLGSRRLMHRQTMLLQPWLFQCKHQLIDTFSV